MVNWNEKRQEKWRAGTLRYADAKVSAATAPLLAEIERLTRELEEARKDAEMYRWLRDYHIGDDPESINLKKAKTKGLDAAIDAAIKEQT